MMDRIFHEKQEGSLCAQHCLNGLLQGEYFTAVDLATIAQQIDEQERETMAEGGLNSDDYQRFMHVTTIGEPGRQWLLLCASDCQRTQSVGPRTCALQQH
uniref:ubiquitinyl hydrolase 1 n=1 Tax=Rhipicephalus zambeziensis TaxID=60191 RepID=A0A224YSN2_9ACAR